MACSADSSALGKLITARFKVVNSAMERQVLAGVQAKLKSEPVITEERVWVRFYKPFSLDLGAKYTRDWEDLVVVQDTAFKTILQNFVLHSVSLAGFVQHRGDIFMRASHLQFVLAHREDGPMYEELLAGVVKDLSDKSFRQTWCRRRGQDQRHVHGRFDGSLLGR